MDEDPLYPHVVKFRTKFDNMRRWISSYYQKKKKKRVNHISLFYTHRWNWNYAL